MPIGGMLTVVFAGWLVKKQFSHDELFRGKDTFLYRAWLFLARFVAPVLLTLVLIDVATA
jgi:NSS family neurotransmitter:Na+ symporter